MKRDRITVGTSTPIAFLTVALALLSLSPLPANITTSAMTPQGKGGEIKPLPPAPKKSSPPRKSTPPRRSAPAAAEIAFWNSIKDSTDPEDFKAYLQEYPNGKFAALARNRLKTLEAGKAKP